MRTTRATQTHIFTWICCVNHLVPGWSMCCRWRNCTRRILRVKSLETDETVPTHQEHKGKELFILKALEYLYNIPDVGFLGVFCLGLKGFQLVFVFVKYALQVCLWSFKRVRGSHTGKEEMLGTSSYLILNGEYWGGLMSHKLCTHNQQTSSSWQYWLHLTTGHTTINCRQQLLLIDTLWPFSPSQHLKLVAIVSPFGLLQANSNTTLLTLKNSWEEEGWGIARVHCIREGLGSPQSMLRLRPLIIYSSIIQCALL